MDNLERRDGPFGEDGPSIAGFAGSILGLQYATLWVFVTLLYDIIITFDQEVFHFYNRRLSIVQVLWFLNRITAPVNVGTRVLMAFWYNPPDISLCRNVGQYFVNIMSLVNVFIVQGLLALRTAAIYERSLGVSLFIGILVLGALISRIAVLLSNPFLNRSLDVPPHGLMCLDKPFRSNAIAFYVPVGVDATLYLMTVLRLYKTQPPSVPGVRRTSTLLPLLYRDGAIYFLAVATAMAISVMGLYIQSLFGAFSSSDLYIAACSIACSRLILHLKESSRRARYQNWRISGSWYPPMGAIVPTGLTRSEMILGFSCDSPPPEVLSPSEEIQLQVNPPGPGETLGVYNELPSSVDSARTPSPSPALDLTATSD